MSSGLKTLIYPVKDVAAATKLYRALLGVDPYVEAPYYVGFKLGDQDLGLDPNGHRQGRTAPVPYWEVDDIKARVEELVEAGAQLTEEVKDVGGGKLIALVADADGNVTGLAQTPAG